MRSTAAAVSLSGRPARRPADPRQWSTPRTVAKASNGQGAGDLDQGGLAQLVLDAEAITAMVAVSGIVVSMPLRVMLSSLTSGRLVSGRAMSEPVSGK
jgi:hypothetical protein